ncbi:MAG TPA: hypothetical protein VNW92_04615 [Polyangiaceae bacterium]|nr:hypothetical protein [Polyangiaceae bacterium]
MIEAKLQHCAARGDGRRLQGALCQRLGVNLVSQKVLTGCNHPLCQNARRCITAHSGCHLLSAPGDHQGIFEIGDACQQDMERAEQTKLLIGLVHSIRQRNAAIQGGSHFRAVSLREHGGDAKRRL